VVADVAPVAAVDRAAAEAPAGLCPTNKGQVHKRHKAEHKKHKNWPEHDLFCAFCVLFVPFVYLPLIRWAKPVHSHIVYLLARAKAASLLQFL